MMLHIRSVAGGFPEHAHRQAAQTRVESGRRQHEWSIQFVPNAMSTAAVDRSLPPHMRHIAASP
ncbi:hypothetical protein, partial [Streptomyces sp. P17]|uniref:hypothetical protein n=1 Tax=Streptomyces sp. P17 TaxID=3074716 RepID=UPI0028F3E8E7